MGMEALIKLPRLMMMLLCGVYDCREVCRYSGVMAHRCPGRMAS
jgi:hypothetical protein